MKERIVQIIPAIKDPKTRRLLAENKRRKVAAYARVSTDSEEQKTSYVAQIDYYTNYINSHKDWDFVKVYTDEGISGTNIKKRYGFQEMIDDAEAGKIDLIVTKSISRFARNTVDTLTTVRTLKEIGVEVFFEKENIHTLDTSGELLITIMSSIAQEESRSISENITWGQRKRFADGKVTLPYSHFLGFEKGNGDFPIVNESQAVIVRRIYKEFLNGKTPCMIANILTQEGIPTPAGKTKWRPSTISSILQNEKYKGSAILQKEYTLDFLTKKMKKNEGEVPQYYIEHSHEAIVSPEIFEAVQLELKRRKEMGKSYSGNSIFSTRIVCGDCGGYYGSKVWHSNSKYRRTIWQCNNKFKNGEHCSTSHLDEEAIRTAFITAFNKLLSQRDELLENCRIMQEVLTDTTEIDEKIEELYSDIEIIEELIKKAIIENTMKAQDQEEFSHKYSKLETRHSKAVKSLKSLEEERQRKEEQAEAIGAFMFQLKENDEPLTDFDERLWLHMIDRVVIYHDEKMQFFFKGGTEVTI